MARGQAERRWMDLKDYENMEMTEAMDELDGQDLDGEQNDRSIERTLEELESVIEKMEDRNCSLEDTFALYESGMKMVKACSDKIEKVEKKIQILSEEGQNEEF